MKRLALYAAAAAVAMTGTGTITSQAAVRTFVIGGNCQTGSSGGSEWGGNNDCSNSVSQILENIFSGSLGSGCSDILNSGFGNSGCGNLGSQNSGCEIVGDIITPGGQVPGCGDLGDIITPGSQTPGCGIVGDIITPGGQIPGDTSTGDQIPGDGNQGGIITPDGQKPGNGNQGTQTPGTITPDTQKPGNQPDDNSYIQQVIDLVNEERAKAGLSPVTEAADVSAAAAVRAEEIVRNFSHTRPNGRNYSTALDEVGVRYMGSGENIAYGQKTAAAVMSGWMNSQGHRANILNGSYTKIGVGYYESANGVRYWVQLFTY